MSSSSMSINCFCFLFFFFSTVFSSIPSNLPNPDPLSVQPLPTSPAPTATIPAFPEQSNIAGCPLNLPDELFHGIKSACGTAKSGEIKRSRCCPALAAWLYSAYSATALGRASRVAPKVSGYDLPLLPDDSETCVDDLGKALREKGIELARPNETCDVMYCYCGIRLHPMSCPEAFSVNQKGKLVGDKSVKRLEKDCLSSSSNVNGFPGLGGCNKCLNSLHQINKKNASNSSKSDARTTQMQNKDCHLMGLTWLLAKNRTAYFHTVSAVLRAIMLNKGNSDPTSCTLGSDGMPLAVDSSEISSQSSSIAIQVSIQSLLVSLCLLLILLNLSVPRF